MHLPNVHELFKLNTGQINLCLRQDIGNMEIIVQCSHLFHTPQKHEMRIHSKMVVITKQLTQPQKSPYRNNVSILTTADVYQWEEGGNPTESTGQILFHKLICKIFNVIANIRADIFRTLFAEKGK